MPCHGVWIKENATMDYVELPWCHHHVQLPNKWSEEYPSFWSAPPTVSETEIEVKRCDTLGAQKLRFFASATTNS